MTEIHDSNSHQPPSANAAPISRSTGASVGLFWGLILAAPLFFNTLRGIVSAFRVSHFDWNYLGKPLLFLLTGFAVAFAGWQWGRDANRMGCFGFFARCLLLAGLVAGVLFLGMLAIKGWVVGGGVSGWLKEKGYGLLIGMYFISLVYVGVLGVVVRWRVFRRGVTFDAIS